MTAHVFLDMDGVVADFEWQIQRMVAEHLGARALPRTRGQGDLSYEKLFPEELRPAIRQIMQAPGFFGTLPVMEGAVDAYHKLLGLGYDVRFLSAPIFANAHNCFAEKYQWLAAHFGSDAARTMILTRDKTLISVPQGVLVDDNPEIVGAVPLQLKHIVFSASYNLQSPGHRINSWTTDDYVDVIASALAPTV